MSDAERGTATADWREDLRELNACQCLPCRPCEVEDRLAAHIERLTAERDALLEEHEAARRLDHWHPEGCRFCAAHDEAERVMKGED